jgi:small subunit ribosomal protein S17
MEKRASRKVRTGKVISNQMAKTITVVVERAFRHPKFERVVRRSSRFKAHDEKNECKVGDVVEIMETRPLSKTKRWRLNRIVEKAK